MPEETASRCKLQGKCFGKTACGEVEMNGRGSSQIIMDLLIELWYLCVILQPSKFSFRELKVTQISTRMLAECSSVTLGYDAEVGPAYDVLFIN